MRRLILAIIASALLATTALAQTIPTTTFAGLDPSPTAGQLGWITDNSGTPTNGEPAAGGGATGNLDLVSWDATQARWEFVQRVPASAPLAEAEPVVGANRVGFDPTESGETCDDVQECLDDVFAGGGGGGGSDPNLGTTVAADSVTITNDSAGSNALIPAATTTTAGVLTGADKTKLDGVETGAAADQTDSEVTFDDATVSAYADPIGWAAANVQAAFNAIQRMVAFYFTGEFPVEAYVTGYATVTQGFREAIADCEAAGGGVVTFSGDKFINAVGLTSPVLDLPGITNSSDAPHGACVLRGDGAAGHGQVSGDPVGASTLFINNLASMTADAAGERVGIRINGSGQRIEGFNYLAGGSTDASVIGILCQSPAGTHTDQGVDALTGVVIDNVRVKAGAPQFGGTGYELRNCQEPQILESTFENFTTGIKLATVTCTDAFDTPGTSPQTSGSPDGLCDDDTTSTAPIFRSANNVFRIDGSEVRANEVGIDIVGAWGCRDAAAYSLTTEGNSVAGIRFDADSNCTFADYSAHHENASGSDNVLRAGGKSAYYGYSSRYGGAATNDLNWSVADDATTKASTVYSGEFNNDVNVTSGATLVLYEPRYHPMNITGTGRLVLHDSTTGGINVPADKDGDGFTDFVAVRHDYNGDGSVTTADIQDAHDDLTATGTTKRTVYLDGGEFDPATGLVEAASGDLFEYDGLVTSASYTTWECAPDVVIKGLPFGDPQDVSFSIFTGDNAGGGGNTEVHLRGCTLDGGNGSAYDSSVTADANSNRMSIRAHRFTDSSFVGNRLIGSGHSPGYFREVSRVQFTDNLIEDSSGYHDTTAGTPVQAQAAIYLFIPDSAGAIASEDVLVARNVVRRATSGVKVRVADSVSVPDTARFRRIVFEDNVFTDVIDIGGVWGGYEDLVIRGNVFTNAGRIALQDGGDTDPWKGGLRAQIIGNTVINAQNNAGSGSGFALAEQHHDVTMLNNSVDTTESACMTIADEMRNLYINGFVGRNCGGHGITWAAGGADYPATLTNFAIESWGKALPITSLDEGVELAEGCENKTISNGRIAGGPTWTSANLRVGNTIDKNRNCTYENLVLDNAPNSFVGAAPFASPPFNGTNGCTDYENGDWAIITDATGNTDVTTGGDVANPQRNVAYCNGTVWVDWAYNGGPVASFEFASADENHSISLRNWSVLNAVQRHDGGGSSIVAVQFSDGAWDNVEIDGIRCASATNKVGREGAERCLDSTGATAFTNLVESGVSCGRTRFAQSNESGEGANWADGGNPTANHECDGGL